MSIHLSLHKFPQSNTVKETLALPWGCVVQPLAQENDSKSTQINTSVSADMIARCGECFGYINPGCLFQRGSWFCNICSYENEAGPRYKVAADRKLAIEVNQWDVDVDIAVEEGVSESPVFIALIDTTAPADVFEVFKSSIQGVVEAIPESSLFGLMTYSNKIGAFDLTSEQPHMKFVHVTPNGIDPSLSLEDIFPKERLFVEVGQFKENILSALEGLKPEPKKDTRSLGSACKVISDFFDIHRIYAGARVLTFISGQPTYGPGSCDPSVTSVSKLRESLTVMSKYYEGMAKFAAKIGICFDLLVISNSYVKLSALQNLSQYTGGIIMHYQNLEECNLPQDLYRQFCGDLAFKGLLRMRTSTDVQLTRPHGHFTVDDEYDFLFHIAGCDKSQCFSFDFDFTSESFQKRPIFPPVIQMAFAYNTISRKLSEDSQPATFQRKLRIVTAQADVADNSRQIYFGIDPEASLTLIIQKISRVIVNGSVDEARNLLKDWLGSFMDKYMVHMSQIRQGSQIDLDFPDYPGLGTFVKMAFSITKSALLRPNQVTPDERYFHQFILSCLEPSQVARSVYPYLITYATPETMGSHDLALSRHTITSSPHPIFILDAYFTILVYYGINASDFEFPPPLDSNLRQHINKLKADRKHTPQLRMIRAGTPDAQIFYNFLIEDANALGAGFREYLDLVITEVKRKQADSR